MKKAGFWNEDSILKDLLFTTNMSIAEIARELDEKPSTISKRIKQLGLSWVRRDNRKLSRGAAALTSMMKKLLPGEEVINEYHIGDRLMLDVYCPKLNVAAEYHGRQHFFYTEHFHGDILGFKESQKRDEKKEEICRNLGIVLVVFRYDENLSEDLVFERLLDAVRKAPVILRDVKPKTRTPYMEYCKEKQREYRKKAYRAMKGRSGRT